MSSLATNHEFRFQRLSCTDHSPSEESKHLSQSIYSSEYRGLFSKTPRLLWEAGCNRLLLLKREVPRWSKQWGRGCPTEASYICAWVPTWKKLASSLSKETTCLVYLAGAATTRGCSSSSCVITCGSSGSSARRTPKTGSLRQNSNTMRKVEIKMFFVQSLL